MCYDNSSIGKPGEFHSPAGNAVRYDRLGHAIVVAALITGGIVLGAESALGERAGPTDAQPFVAPLPTSHGPHGPEGESQDHVVRRAVVVGISAGMLLGPDTYIGGY